MEDLRKMSTEDQIYYSARLFGVVWNPDMLHKDYSGNSSTADYCYREIADCLGLKRKQHGMLLNALTDVLSAECAICDFFLAEYAYISLMPLSQEDRHTTYDRVCGQFFQSLSESKYYHRLLPLVEQVYENRMLAYWMIENGEADSIRTLENEDAHEQGRTVSTLTSVERMWTVLTFDPEKADAAAIQEDSWVSIAGNYCTAKVIDDIYDLLVIPRPAEEEPPFGPNSFVLIRQHIGLNWSVTNQVYASGFENYYPGVAAKAERISKFRNASDNN